MGVQQLIANNSNILLDASVIASTVTASADIARTAITRQGTGLAELSGLYTGHTDATYDVEIITGSGNGRASTPVFSGVGSGTLAVTAAGIPAQDVSITLLVPPYPGAVAECLIGKDIIRAKSAGVAGNLLYITVNRSGLTFTASGSSTLEEIAEGDDELTGYKWDIPGVVCRADLKGNVPDDAPRLRFGSDPAIYRVVKDARSGSIKTMLSPAAVRPIPAGVPIWLVTGTYTATVTDGTTTETYPALTTAYDLVSALLASTIVEPAYTPAPATTIGGNAVVDLPLATGATGLLTGSSSANVRPEEITARSTALADTIRFTCRGNGSWSVLGNSGTQYTDCFEGQEYSPSDSPIMITIPAKPASGNTATQPVYISDTEYTIRDTAAELPLLCISGALGKNAVPKSITATYAKRPATADCPCPTGNGRFNQTCLGLTSTIGGDIMSLDPAYQSRLIALYQWQQTALGYDANIASGTTEGRAAYTDYSLYARVQGYYNTSGYHLQGSSTASAEAVVVNAGFSADTMTASINASTIPAGFFTEEYLNSEYDTIIPRDYIIIATNHAAAPGSPSLLGSLYPADVDCITSATQIMADTLAQIWDSVDGIDAYDAWIAAVKAELSALQSRSLGSGQTYYSLLYKKYTAGANAVLAAAGIVPGKPDPASGIASTGCWQDVADSDYWWLLSGGYAPAFTGEEYYSTRAGSFENTQEFAFYIKCGCPDRLLEGDRLEITIGAGIAAANWSSNEWLEITTIPTTPLYLAGGKAADDSETWAIAAKDSSSATLPQFVADAVNRGYSSGGLEFTLAKGGIPYNTGDRFTFTVEGGTFKWRKDAGSWSSATAIADNTTLDSGLYVSFMSGSAPSFVTGDSYSFRANQTSAATGLLAPDASTWTWPDATATITLTIPTSRTISTLVCLHSLPTGTAIAVDYWDAEALPEPAFKPLAWASGVVRDYLHMVTGIAITTTKIRIIADNPGSIRWLWAGVPLQPIYSGSLRIRKQYDMARAKEAGSAVMLAEGTGASIAWDFLDIDDADNLLDMVRYVKVNGDQPVILIPQHLHPEEWCIGRLADDGIEISDLLEYQPDDTSKRILSGTMELTPEWR